MAAVGGVTIWLPDTGFDPLQSSIAVQDVALVVDQVRVEEFPKLMEVGLAVNVRVGAGVPDTVTVAEALAEPAELVAVRVYVVVTEGETALFPDVDTPPIPWSIETEVALVVDQLRVEEAPGEIEVGFVLKVIVGTDTLLAFTDTAEEVVVFKDVSLATAVRVWDPFEAWVEFQETE